MKARLLLAIASLAALTTTTIAYADPPGTITVTDRRVPSIVTIRGASPAGILYETDSSLGNHSAFWLKEPGEAAVQLGWSPGPLRTINGRMVFDYTGSTVRYSIWNGPMHTCAVYEYGGVQYLPTGWAYFDKFDNSIKRVTATNSGCTTQTFLTTTATRLPQEVIGGDATGMVIREQHVAGGRDYLAYYPYDDPAHPVALDSPAKVFSLFSRYDTVRGGVVLVTANTGPGVTTRTWRVPLNGGAAHELAEPAYWDVATATQTAVVSQGLKMVAATGGAVQTLTGVTGEVYSDGTRFYSGQATEESPGIYARTTVASSSQVVAPPSTTYPSEQWGIALSPGRVYYTDRQPTGTTYPQTYDVRMRTTTTGPETVAVGAEQTIGGTALYPSLSASAGRLVFDGKKQRTYTGSVLTMNTTVADLPEMSGNRWLIGWSSGSGADTMSGRAMYDVRTGKTASGTWPQGPQDLFGNYLLYARSDGGVRLRNLLTGAETAPRPAGTKLAAVAVHTQWAAWVTACAGVDCTQTLSLRDLGTGSTRTVTTHHTTSLDLSGGYLAYDSSPASGSGDRELRTLRADNGATQVIGSLPRYPQEGAIDEGHFAPRHFDVDDEVIGWLDRDHVARLAHLAPTIDAPRYLGNAIAASSFTTSWSIALPVSKALPTCTVAILRGSTTVRTLGCANTTGMVAVTWDGRNGSGTVQPAGTYTYRVSGQDDDKYWMRNYNGSLTSVTGTMTKTA